MGARVAVVVLLALVTGAALADAALDDSIPRPLASSSCITCHNTVVGASPPIRALVDLVPPEAAGAAVGVPFDYTVQAHNAWTAQLLSVSVRLDLSAAPSLGFASDAQPFDTLVADAIAFQPMAPNVEQRRAIPVTIPDGEGAMQVELRPTGTTAPPDVALLVYPPGRPLDAAPLQRVDDALAGGAERYEATRDDFNIHGYGEWTFVAATTFVSPGSVALPSGPAGAPFELEVHAQPGSTADRVVAAEAPGTLAKGQAAPVTFRLVATGLPALGESVTMESDAWAHYKHDPTSSSPPDDDENITTPHAVPIPVQVDLAGQPALVAGTIAPPPPPVADGASMAAVSEAVGYATAFLMTSSVTTGGMFGKASRRGLNAVFGAAKRRVAFHNALSYGILVAATAHMVLFFIEALYHWTLGLLWGGLGLLALLGLGLTGALQVPMIRSWGYNPWRWTHYGLAVAALVFTVVHGLLDGAHFGDVQEAVGWRDPLVRDRVT